MAARVEPGFEQDKSLRHRDASKVLSPDLARVLVVGNSQINRIVVSKIVERSGLRPASETPLTALRVLPLMFPGLVIMDGGPENADCDAVISGILALRSVSGNGTPMTILLSNRTTGGADKSARAGIDVVVAKPFTTEQLQPVVDRLLDQARRNIVAQPGTAKP